MGDKSGSLKDQATELRNQFNEEISKESQQNQKGIDILNLPPRKEVHTQKQRAHLKWSRPFSRFILVFLILLLFVIVTYFSFGGDIGKVLFSLAAPKADFLIVSHEALLYFY